MTTRYFGPRSPMASNFAICNLFVDGGYVREERKSRGLPLEFDPRAAGKGYLMHDAGMYLGKRFAMTRCFYFDALDPSDQEMAAFFERLDQLDETFVYRGTLVGKGARRRQKGVDLLLAVEALKVARSGNTDAIALLAGDADFVPLVNALRDEGPLVYVLGFRDSVASALLNAADRKYVFDDFDGSWTMPN